jgi:hypothetical protein
MRWPLLASILTASSGCSLVFGTTALTGSRALHEELSYVETPTGVERGYDVTLTPGSLAVACQPSERTHLQIREDQAQWGSSWMITAVGLAALESVLAVVLYANADHPDTAAAQKGIALGLVADGLFTVGINALMPQRSWVLEYPDNGPWRSIAGASECPSGLRLEYAGRLMPVGVSGHLAAVDESWLVWQVVVSGGEVRLVAGAVLSKVSIERDRVSFAVADRCSLARQVHHPAATQLCPPAWGPPPPLLPPPPPPPRVRIEIGLPPR